MFPPGPKPGPLGVNVAEQLAEPPEPDNVHGLVPLKLPGPSRNMLTVPVGVVAGALTTSSVTVAVHVAG